MLLALVWIAFGSTGVRFVLWLGAIVACFAVAAWCRRKLRELR